MNQNNRSPLIHAHHLFILVFVFFILIVIPGTEKVTMIWALSFFILSLVMGLKWKKAFLILLVTLFFSFSVFVLFLFFPDKRFFTGDLYPFFGMSFYSGVIENAFKNWLRLWSISLCSLSTSSVLNAEELIFYWMQEKGVPKKMGYSLLMALNSIRSFKEEWVRISRNLKMRKLNHLNFVARLFPIMVHSFRVSLRGAMSMRARGLVEDKVFYHQYRPSLWQYRVFYFLVFILGLQWLLTL